MSSIKNWSQEDILEACRQSKQFFLEHFYTIPNIQKGGLMKFKLRYYQKDILSAVDESKNIIGLKARQIGWTTIAVANALHDVLFNEWRPWTFISRNEKAAQDMVNKANIAYARLPGWMRQALPVLEGKTQGGLLFDNGSRIVSEPATASSFRGDAVYGLLMDECAFMEYAEEIWGAVEAGVYGPRMLFSTANGMGNFFHDIWLDSQAPNSAWTGIFYPWSVVPERNDMWYEAKRLEHRARPWFFFQEYPNTPEEAFAKSGRVAFALDIVEDCYDEIVPEKVLQWVVGQEPIVLPSDQWGMNDIEIKIYKEPIVRTHEDGRLLARPNYTIGVDVAEGLEHGDYTYVTVFDTYNNEQVASCKTHMPVHYLSELVEWLGYYYHKALVVVERNMAGIVPLDQLALDRYYPRMYRMDRFAEIPLAPDRTPRYGWYTDRKTKPKMVLDFQKALAEGNVILHDPEFRLEAQTFIADGKGSYGATEGNHDDVIMGTLVAWQGLMDSPSYPVIWRDEAVRPITHEELDNLIFADKPKDNPLERPLGRPAIVHKRKSFILTPGNIGR